HDCPEEKIVNRCTNSKQLTSIRFIRFTSRSFRTRKRTEELAVFLAHPVHALAGGFHLVGMTDALREIIEGLPQLGFDLFRDAGKALGRVHGVAPVSPV